MRKTLIALLLLVPWPTLAGEVQCNCPSVPAEGTGDTSCSATESNEVCTIDFNTFAIEDEQAALELLSDATTLPIRYQRFDRRKFPGGFRREQATQLADQAIIYLT